MSRVIIIRQADGSEQNFSEKELPLRIGSDSQNHLVLPGGDPLVALVGEYQGHLFIQPADELASPIFHNGRSLTASAWLKSGDEIRLQSHVILYERQAEQPEALPQAPAAPPAMPGQKPSAALPDFTSMSDADLDKWIAENGG